jgi:hypothetical protein
VRVGFLKIVLTDYGDSMLGASSRCKRLLERGKVPCWSPNKTSLSRHWPTGTMCWKGGGRIRLSGTTAELRGSEAVRASYFGV